MVLLGVVPVCAQRAKAAAASPAAVLTAQTTAFLQQYVNKACKVTTPLFSALLTSSMPCSTPFRNSMPPTRLWPTRMPFT